jgi:hypothetical protein
MQLNYLHFWGENKYEKFEEDDNIKKLPKTIGFFFADCGVIHIIHKFEAYCEFFAKIFFIFKQHNHRDYQK